MKDCTRCESPVDRGDLRCTICGEAVPAAGADTEDLEQVEIERLRCEGCGAAVVSFSVEAQAPQCGFCSSVMHVETITDPLEQTEHYLPFELSLDDAQSALQAWFGRQGFFRVQDLGQRAKLEVLRPLWWVGWVFDATARISWAADSNAGSHRSHWAPHSGQVEMDFDDVLVSASRGLSSAEVDALTPSYDLGTRRERPEGLDSTDAFVEQFDVQRSLARRRIADGVVAAARGRVERDEVPGSRVRKLQVVALLRRLVTVRYAFPAYVFAYRYKGDLFRAVVSGQDADVVIGEAPLSWFRILAVVFGSILAVTTIVAVALLIASA